MAGSIYSVAQVNSYIKNLFVQDFLLNRISVRGEVSNCKYHTSGHIYFTLKDKSGTLSAVMFAGQRNGLTFQLQEGQQVVVNGSIDIYERDGRFQLYAREIRRDGVGDLFERFQKLRDELEEMGMFAAEYKKPIPKYAKTIGIVTASTGAAIHDIINITARRNPYVQLILYPALVQGQDARFSIVNGIRTLDSMGLDVLIVGRGGGSMEDLWAFNEEMVARAIFACRTPVISAVGHETDVTLADFAAAVRAGTPSMAAELAVPDRGQEWREISEARARCESAVQALLRRKAQVLAGYLSGSLLQDPARLLASYHLTLDQRWTELDKARQQTMIDKQIRFSENISTLDALSPLKVLARGYSFCEKEGVAVRSTSQLAVGDALTLHFADGAASCTTTSIDQKRDEQ